MSSGTTDPERSCVWIQSVRRDTLTFGAAACGIISSCVSTFYAFSCWFSVKQINPGWGLWFPLGRTRACNARAPDASVTLADANISHVCALSCELLQQLRYMREFNLHQSTPASCWTYFQTASAGTSPKIPSPCLLSSSFWVWRHTSAAVFLLETCAFVFNWIVLGEFVGFLVPFLCQHIVLLAVRSDPIWSALLVKFSQNSN